jgi:homocysteine S-methyltransferase
MVVSEDGPRLAGLLAPFFDRQGFVMLDGGLATELENRGHDLNNPLWSASLLHNHPDEILAVHRAYLNAGTDCITAASYQASLPGFMAAGFSKSESTALLRKAVDIACLARDHYFEKAKHGQGLRPLVAASIGTRVTGFP